MNDMEIRRKRAVYRAAHRGFKEADLVIGRFAAAACNGFTEAELAAFEGLLDESDHDLYSWVVGCLPPPARVDGRLIERLREFAGSGGASAPVDIGDRPI